jgi:hypothetical protein
MCFQWDTFINLFFNGHMIILKRYTMKKLYWSWELTNNFKHWVFIIFNLRLIQFGFKIEFSIWYVLSFQFNQQSTTIYVSQLVIFYQTFYLNNAYGEQIRPFGHIRNLFILHSNYLTMSLFMMILFEHVTKGLEPLHNKLLVILANQCLTNPCG